MTDTIIDSYTKIARKLGIAFWARNLKQPARQPARKVARYENTTEKEKAKKVFSGLQKRKISFDRFERKKERARAEVLREKRYFVIYLAKRKADFGLVFLELTPETGAGFSLCFR